MRNKGGSRLTQIIHLSKMNLKKISLKFSCCGDRDVALLSVNLRNEAHRLGLNSL